MVPILILTSIALLDLVLAFTIAIIGKVYGNVVSIMLDISLYAIVLIRVLPSIAKS